MTNVILPDTIDYLSNSIFDGCEKLESVNLPQVLRNIGDFAFRNCSGLSEIAIPETIDSIGIGAFQGRTGFKSLYVPEAVNSIGDKAFADCLNIRNVYCRSAEPPVIGDKTFEGLSQYTKLYVPQAAIEDYQFALGWRNFAYILPVDDIVATSLTLSAKRDTINIGDLLTVHVKVLPDGADRTLEWASSDSTVARVDANGIVTVLAAGEVAITARTLDGTEIEAQYDLTVIVPPIGPGDVDGNGIINVSDVTSLINAILDSDDALLYDVNGDGEVNVSDVTALVNIILQ